MSNKQTTPEKLLAAGRWTEFLRSLPLRRAKQYKFESTGQIMTLKVIAAQQSRKEGSVRQYSVKGVDYENLTAIIEANPKNGSN